MSGDEPPTNDLRARLAHIPRIDDVPINPSELGGERVSIAFEDLESHPPLETDAPPSEYVEIEAPPDRRRRWPWVLLATVVVVGLVVGLSAFSAWRAFDSIERVQVSESFAAAPSGRNILVIGTDSRDGIDSDTANAGNILGEGIAGERSDTIMVLHLGEDGAQRMMSIPRDLWLPINGGSPQRVNTAIAQGPGALVNTIQNELGIPITGYVEVDLAGFIDVVDALGGVTISIPYPAFDRASGLNLAVAGEVELDSTQALAYVRSRRYTEIIDGVERPDPTSDLGRVKRQQTFLRALIAEAMGERNPLTLNDTFSSVAEAVRIDDRASFLDTVGLALDVRGGLPESVELPTRGARIGAASVLELTAEADQVLADFVR